MKKDKLKYSFIIKNEPKQKRTDKKLRYKTLKQKT